MPCFDVAVVGAGPAGALLARQLGGSGFRVALIEARDLGRAPVPGREKSCGGLLAPDAQVALAALDLALPERVLAAPLCFSVRAVDLPLGLERWYSRSYINIHRPLLDRWLFELAAATPGVQALCPARVQGLEAKAGGWTLTCRRPEGSFAVHARMLVGADGAASLVRRRLFGADMPAYVSIQEYFLRDQEEKPHMAAFFDAKITDYYAWAIPKGGEYLLGAALHPQGAERNFARLKARLAPWGYGQGLALRREVTRINRPGLAQIMAAKSGNGAFLLGEAAGLISPSSAEGLSLALTGAHLLHTALVRHPGDAKRAAAVYERLLHGLRLRLCGKWLKSAVIYGPCLRRMVMQSGIMSLNRWA